MASEEVKRNRIESRLLNAEARKNPKLKLKLTPVERAKLAIEMSDDFTPIKTTEFDFTARKGSQAVKGKLRYIPAQEIKRLGRTTPEISISGIAPLSHTTEAFGDIHPQAAGRTMSRQFIKEALLELKKRFPKAEKVVGSRVTGAKARAAAHGLSESIQEFDLGKLAKRAKKGLGTKLMSIVGPVDILGKAAAFSSAMQRKPKGKEM